MSTSTGMGFKYVEDKTDAERERLGTVNLSNQARIERLERLMDAVRANLDELSHRLTEFSELLNRPSKTNRLRGDPRGDEA